MLGRRIPRLKEKVIDASLIDSVDGGVRVGVGSKQSALGSGKDLSGFAQEFDTVHARHALVGKQQRDAVVPHL